MHPQFTAAMVEQRRRQLVADASHARLAATVRTKPRLRAVSKHLRVTGFTSRKTFRVARPVATA